METVLQGQKKNLLLTTKSLVLLVLFSLMYANSVIAQVAINEDDSNGNTAADLDVKSTTKGLIFPVMTAANRDALQSPVQGLLIFNRSGGYHNYYDGTNWLQINRVVVTAATNPSAGTGTDIGVGVGITDPDNSAILHINSTTKGFLLPRPSAHPNEVNGILYYNSVANMILYFDGTDWKQVSTSSTGVPGAGGTSTAAGVLIGTGTIEASAKMEVRTTDDKGMLIPRMTAAQRDVIDSPYEGLTIYDIDNNDIEFYAANTWYKWDNSANDYGQIIANPGQSCKDIYDNNPATQGVDGTYYIDPDGTGANTAYACTCDMTTDGGGWTLVENTGPKSSATNTTGAVGGSPISTGVGTAHNKLSDSDINLIRGNYATAIVRLERPNGNASAYNMYFVENLAFNSNAPNGQQLRKYHTNYADAVSGAGQYSSNSGYTSGLSTWAGGAGTNYYIILDFNAEGLISNTGNYQCEGAGSNNRSECNALLWIK